MAATAGPAAVTETGSDADVDVAEVAIADAGGADAADAPAGRRWLRILLSLIGIAATVTLVAGVVTAGSTWLADRSRDEHRQTLADAAADGVLALISVQTDTADADLARLRGLSTGQFADELADGEAGLATAIRDSAVNSDGRIDAAALASENDGSAVVIVAASAQVANVDSPTAAPRSYRLRVTVDDVDGRPLMSKVEFVP